MNPYVTVDYFSQVNQQLQQGFIILPDENKQPQPTTRADAVYAR